MFFFIAWKLLRTLFMRPRPLLKCRDPNHRVDVVNGGITSTDVESTKFRRLQVFSHAMH